MLTDNYARDGRGSIQFFPAGSPPPHLLTPRWSFWRLPEGWRLDRFPGRLIGETGDERCERLSHHPRTCARCQRDKRR